MALCVGAVVCIAAANAGNTSQDLKTGYIVGATPLYQQIGLIVGVVVSAFAIGLTTLYLHRVFTIGSAAIAAPQATLMATIIKGLLSQNLPWGLVLVGVFLAVTLELCGIHSLSFAVGAYLPVATTAPIFAGGLVRWWVESKSGVKEESELGGNAVQLGADRRRIDLRILFAVLVGTETIGPFQAIGNLVPWLHDEGAIAQIGSGLLFFALAVVTPARREGAFREPGLMKRLVVLGLLLTTTVAAQTSQRRTTNIAALLAHPAFYHFHPVVLVGKLELRNSGEMRLADDAGSVRVIFKGSIPDEPRKSAGSSGTLAG